MEEVYFYLEFPMWSEFNFFVSVWIKWNERNGMGNNKIQIKLNRDIETKSDSTMIVF